MATFSWSDNLKIALRACSPCLLPREDSEEDNGSGLLQGLLTNDADTDIEAERMSLHSNPGQRKKRKRSSRSSGSQRRIITLFGYNLFGRSPPIHLPDDTQDALYSRQAGTTTPNTISSSTAFDSDAAPLDTGTIAALSSSPPGAVEMDAQRINKEKEERRRKRKKKKEMKRMADLLARQEIVDDGEFEGFQGSGPGSFSNLQQERPIPGGDDGDDDDDTADLDGSHYARNTSGGSNGGSDSRSRTSASMSDRPKPKSSCSRTTKSSSSNASQVPSPRQVVSPSTIEQGQGFFDLEEVDVRGENPGYMPITGFGGTTRGNSRIASNLGAVLAQRGNDSSVN